MSDGNLLTVRAEPRYWDRLVGVKSFEVLTLAFGKECEFFRFINEQGESFLLKVRSLEGRVVKIRCLSFEECCEYSENLPNTNEGWQKWEKVLSKQPLIKAEKRDRIEFHWGTFIFSPELLTGMEGKRDANHRIERDLIQKCLLKMKNQKKFSPEAVKKITRLKPLSPYFHVMGEDGSSRILNLVIDHDPKHPNKKEFVLRTGYFLMDNQARLFSGDTDVAYQNWKETRITQIEF